MNSVWDAEGASPASALCPHCGWGTYLQTCLCGRLDPSIPLGECLELQGCPALPVGYRKSEDTMLAKPLDRGLLGKVVQGRGMDGSHSHPKMQARVGYSNSNS